MIKNYLKVALRHIWRNKVYSVINISGLTIGITCSCLLFLFIQHELSYDSFHDKSDRIYRVIETLESPDQGTRLVGQTSPAVADLLTSQFPQVKSTVRLYQPQGHVNFVRDGERFAERGWFMADQNFFEIFDFEFIHGDPETALEEPKSLVLTESASKKYFGDANPVGQSMKEMSFGEVNVTGVIKDLPSNSHLQFDVLFSRLINDDRWQQYVTDWNSYGAFTYVLLNDNTDLENLTSQFEEIASEKWKEVPSRNKFFLQPLTDIYFGSGDVEFGLVQTKGEYFYIYLFGAIAIFILMIASINYMNLATAKSIQRTKEIGMRKASGAYRWQIAFQFLSESLILAFISFGLSLGLIDLLLPYFNEITGKQFAFSLATLNQYLVILLSLALLIGLLSGSYPALYLSRMKPSESLKGEVKTGRKNLLLRKILVITQFTLSIIMIVATIVVSRQMNYINSKEMGFDSDKMLIIDINNGNVRSNFQAMKTEFSRIQGVQNVASSSRVPGEWKTLTEIYAKPAASIDSVNVYYMAFDEDMIETYDIKILEGSDFIGNKKADSTNLILNQTAVQMMGLENPVGKNIYFSGVGGPFKVIGVVEDFHFQSLHQNIEPLIIGYWANPIRVIDYFSLKLAGDDLSRIINDAKVVHKQFDDSTPMEYHFLDQQLDRFYEADQRAKTLFSIGAGLTIFIACLGLFGLASYIVQRRTKEISVRKVLGASSFNLFLLMSKTFIYQVMIAFTIAAPIAYFTMDNWLDYFAYKVDLSIGIFLLAGFTALFVALISVTYRAIQAVMLNPADTLKTE